jgi:hypothetical protein
MIGVLNENHGLRRDFLAGEIKVLRGFSHRSNAFRAHNLFYFPTVLSNGNTLKVRAKSAIGGSHRKASIVAKSCSFTTNFALCHFIIPFLQ